MNNGTVNRKVQNRLYGTVTDGAVMSQEVMHCGDVRCVAKRLWPRPSTVSCGVWRYQCNVSIAIDAVKQTRQQSSIVVSTLTAATGASATVLLPSLHFAFGIAKRNVL